MQEKKDKIILTGATGWFGEVFLKCFIKLYGVEETKARLVLFSSDGRNVIVNGVMFTTSTLDCILKENAKFIVHAACLTRDKISLLGENKYRELNKNIFNHVSEYILRNKTDGMFYISSGAAGNVKVSDAYSEIKSSEEKKFSDLVEDIFIFRVYAAISNGIPHREWSALSDFIESAKSNREIRVNAKGKVIRGFVSFEDLSLIIIKCIELKIKGKHFFDAVEYVITLTELANKISKIAGVNVNLEHDYDEDSIVSDYSADPREFRNFASKLGVKISSLDLYLKNNIL